MWCEARRGPGGESDLDKRRTSYAGKHRSAKDDGARTNPTGAPRGFAGIEVVRSWTFSGSPGLSQLDAADSFRKANGYEHSRVADFSPALLGYLPRAALRQTSDSDLLRLRKGARAEGRLASARGGQTRCEVGTAEAQGCLNLSRTASR